MVTRAETVSVRSSCNQVFSNFNILEFSIPPKLKGKISDSTDEWKVHNAQIKDIWADTNLGTDSEPSVLQSASFVIYDDKMVIIHGSLCHHS